MVLFLTSSFIEYKDLDNPLPVHLLSDNGFVDDVDDVAQHVQQ